MEETIDMATGELIPARKPFGQFLLEQRDGGLHSELSEALQTLVAAVAEHGKAGALTLTVRVAPIKNAMFGQLVITDDVKVKAPEGERGASLFFEDGNGNLSRSNPRQPELPLRDIPAADDSPIRKVS